MMSRYINTIGYEDRWIQKVLDIYDKQGVANETLVIFQGDHGVSLTEMISTRHTITTMSV
jgi:glucan phosphoethanolaminetransferase (alkaline phosphatase superfamily)